MSLSQTQRIEIEYMRRIRGLLAIIRDCRELAHHDVVVCRPIGGDMLERATNLLGRIDGELEAEQ